MKLIVGISGASGSILGIRLLEHLKKSGIETHLIMTEPAQKILEHETDYKVSEVKKLATKVYDNKDMFSAVASGTFRTDGMVIIPCSMKTLAGVANGFSENLLLRAADVCLKEKRKLVLVPRETPLSHIHIDNMHRVSRAGGIILPPVLSFYQKPKNLNDIVNQILGKILDMFGVKNKILKRWCE